MVIFFKSVLHFRRCIYAIGAGGQRRTRLSVANIAAFFGDNLGAPISKTHSDQRERSVRMKRFFAGISFVVLIAVSDKTFAEGVAVVVHPNTPVANLTLPEVRLLFLGDRHFWSSQMRVILINPAPDSPERTVLLKIICQMSEAQFAQYWISKVFRGDIPIGPKTVFSSEMAIELVGKIPGAIALVNPSQINQRVKVLKINGYLPEEEGYPFR